MATIQAGDLQVNHVLEGDAAAPLVMLAHGVMTSHRMWDDVAALLAPRWRTLRYDLRGHGATTVADGPYTMPQLADDAALLLDALQIDKAHFIGASLGGMIGQQLAARHDHRLLSLTMANTAAVQSTPDAWNERIAVAQAKGMQPLVEPTLQRWFAAALFAAQAPLLDKMRGIAAAASAQGFIRTAAAIRDLDQADILGRIATPTLIVAGQHDQATPLAESQAMQSLIAGSQLAVLPAAHQSAAERPADFVRIWEQFVAVHSLPN